MRGFFRTPFYGEWQIEKKLGLLLSSFSGVLGGCPEDRGWDVKCHMGLKGFSRRAYQII